MRGIKYRNLNVTGVITPLIGIVLLSAFVDKSNIEALMTIFIGNLLLCFMFENTVKMSNIYAHMKTIGSLQFFITLPINKIVFFISLMAAFTILSLPSLALVLLLGSWLLKIKLTISPFILLSLPLLAVSFQLIGITIATYSKSMLQAAPITTVIVLLLTVSVIIPSSSDKFILMKVLGIINPVKYAASMFKQMLAGPFSNKIFLDASVLAFFSVVLIILITKKKTV